MTPAAKIDKSEILDQVSIADALAGIPGVKYARPDFANMVVARLHRDGYKKPVVMVINDGDLGTTTADVERVEKLLDVRGWFVQNNECPKANSLPIGIESCRGKDWELRPNYTKKDMLAEFMSRANQMPSKLAYGNFTVGNYPQERELLAHILRQTPWVTYREHYALNESWTAEQKHRVYLEDLLDHHYVFCPRGAGEDTHRMWESLYLGRIPIVKKTINNRDFRDLPVLWIDDWREVTKDLLESKLEGFRASCWNFDKLKLSYWKSRVEAECRKIGAL